MLRFRLCQKVISSIFAKWLNLLHPKMSDDDWIPFPIVVYKEEKLKEITEEIPNMDKALDGLDIRYP